MKYLKWPLIILVGLALIYAALCALGPANFNTVRSLEIDAPKNMIYNVVNDYKLWQKWSPWVEQDSTMVSKLGDQTIGVGASSSWTGKDGEGKMVMLESVKGERIKNQLNFEGFDGNAYGIWDFKDEKGKTKVSWTMDNDTDLPFLMRGMMLVVGAKGGMEKSFEKGLQNIKEIVEQQHKHRRYDGYTINEAMHPEKHYVMSRSEVETDKMQQFYATNLGAIFGKVQGAGLEMDGMPSGLFFKLVPNAQKTDMAAAIPVKEAIQIPGLTTYTIKDRKAIVVDYYGDYNDTQKAHDAIKAYLNDYNLLYDAPVIEEYVTDPTEEKDPSKWLTKITYYPAE